MPVQSPQWTEYLSCPVCENGFESRTRLPISLGCGHTICQTCLAQLRRRVCPFDQGQIRLPLAQLPVNTSLILLIDPDTPLDQYRIKVEDETIRPFFLAATVQLEKLAQFLRVASRQPLSRPMQRKLVTLINCQLLEEEGRARVVRSARSLGERSVTELILQHQNPQQLSANLWAAVRARGCQFLGPAMQEEVLKLVLLALEDGSALSRKVLVMFVVQRLEPHFPQASKTSIGHVVQLLYRASCFKVTKRDGDSSLMQLKEEFRTYDTLRREHDAQIVQIATEAGLRIAPDQWSSLLYGDGSHKSHMQSIIDKLQTPQSFIQSVQELIIALQRTGDPGNLGELRPHLDFLAALDPNQEGECPGWETLNSSLNSVHEVVQGLQVFIEQQTQSRKGLDPTGGQASAANARYKTSLCRDLASHGSCPRGKNCTFAHSQTEMDQFRNSRKSKFGPNSPLGMSVGPPPPPPHLPPSGRAPVLGPKKDLAGFASPMSFTPVAQVAPLQRGLVTPMLPNPSVDPTICPPMASVLQLENPSLNEVPLLHPTPPPAFPADHSNSPHSMGSFHQNPTVMTVQPIMPKISEHDSNYDRYPPRCESQNSNLGFPEMNMATKSLGALKSRKEEIIDYLEDLVGKEEAEHISKKASINLAHNLEKNQLRHSKSAPSQSNYSIWTSRSIASLPSPCRNGTGHAPGGGKVATIQPNASATDDEKELKNAASEPVMSQSEDEEVEAHMLWPEGKSFFEEEEEMIPFSDTPLICRFGPISRKAGTLLQLATPSQTQAIIKDEPTPTAVVRHSKQLTRQVPSLASLYHQNGTRTTLQPVAIGANGEISYVAVPESVFPTPDLALQQIQQNSALHQQGSSGTAANNPPTSSQQSLFAESERMKHELEMLQKKISDLNMAHIEHQQVGLSADTNSQASLSNGGDFPTPMGNAEEQDLSREKDDLARELHMIESTIRDREQEISANRLRIETSDSSMIPSASSFGAFAASHGMVHYDESGGGAISPSTSA
eukprot:maker-scaffold589_size129586-snap-gene-0.39 protein:Tk07337 transcript:maker-scaffold589_size129586-snap-gene-0.39-mRNA-1 annotation:"PREDICTED: roquin-1"